MEFFNIGGGEILVIILLALLFFGPEDIMKIMRTLGKYTRAASRAWAKIRASLDGELLPEEVREVVAETKDILKEISTPLGEVTQSVNEVEAVLKEEAADLDTPLTTAARDAKTATAKARSDVKAEIAAAKTSLDKEVARTATVVQDEIATLERESAALQAQNTEIADSNPPDPSSADATVSDEMNSPDLQDVLAVLDTVEIEESPEPPSPPRVEIEVPDDPGVGEIMALLGDITSETDTPAEATV